MPDLTPNQIAHGLIHYAQQLEDLVNEYRALGEASATARKDAEVAYAHAYLTADGTVEERKQRALEATADERHTADIAEHLVKACSKAIDAKRERIAIGRTLSATTREEMKLSGVA